MTQVQKYLFWIIFFGLGIAYISDFFLYWSAPVPWIDIPLHFLGGVWAALLFVPFFTRLFHRQTMENLWERALIVVLIVSFAAFIGVLWELQEFLVVKLFGFSLQPGIADTMGDLTMDMIGGLFMALLIMKPEKKLA